MATVPQPTRGPFDWILDLIARQLGRNGIRQGSPGEAPGMLRIELERNVSRTVQVYWTPFHLAIPGESIGLHLEVAEPRVHWAEAYIAPHTSRSWVFCFAEREDGEIQLTHYADKALVEEAIQAFFDLATWHVLTATENTWEDVVYTVSPELDWSTHLSAMANPAAKAAVQESLKKSSIVWLRWDVGGVERTHPVWFVYDNKTDKIYVISGERQQKLPGAETMRECDVIFRWKGQNSQVGEVPASVRVIEGNDPDWEQVAEKLAEKRLNIPGLPEETAQRWRESCVILELTLRA